MRYKHCVLVAIFVSLLFPYSSVNAQEQSLDSRVTVGFYHGNSEEVRTITDSSDSEISKIDTDKSDDKKSLPNTGSENSRILSILGVTFLLAVYYKKKIWRNNEL